MSANRVIRIVCMADGRSTGFDGQFIVECDPSRDGTDPEHGWPTPCYLVTTPDITQATQYSIEEATELWQAVDQRKPVRPDGKPNRPLTAFTVMIEPVRGE